MSTNEIVATESNQSRFIHAPTGMNPFRQHDWRFSPIPTEIRANRTRTRSNGYSSGSPAEQALGSVDCQSGSSLKRNRQFMGLRVVLIVHTFP